MSTGLLQMPMKATIRNGEINLSFRDLKEVPIREIAAVKAVTILNLSNNQLVTLGDNFCQLTYIQKLDLSKNRLRSLPVNFGNLILLKNLDLSSNQLRDLPPSFGKLKNLKWLSLKNNPLVLDLAAIIGPCKSSQQCQDCAKYVIKFLREAQLEPEKERQKVMDNGLTMTNGSGAEMKELQRKKEKKAKKKNKVNEKKNDNNKYRTNLVRKTGQKNNFYRNINDNNYYNNSNVKSSRKKSESGNRRSFIWILINGTTFILLAFGFIYLVDFEKFNKIKDSAYFYANKFLNILPPEVVTKGKETVEYIRPFAEVTASKINVILNETSTFLNTNPLVKDHWTNIREIISISSACLLDYIRTLYWHSTTYCNDVKNKLFQ